MNWLNPVFVVTVTDVVGIIAVGLVLSTFLFGFIYIGIKVLIEKIRGY